MIDIHKVIGKIPFKPKKDFFYHNIVLLEPITRYIYNQSNQLANELHKPVRKRLEKRTVFAKQINGIWTADFQIEQGLQISPDCD